MCGGFVEGMNVSNPPEPEFCIVKVSKRRIPYSIWRIPFHNCQTQCPYHMSLQDPGNAYEAHIAYGHSEGDSIGLLVCLYF